MALIVETGTGSATSESYQSVADWKTWATARGHSYVAYSDTLIENALRRATSWLDARYQASFPGTRTNARSQALAWPRDGAADVEGNSIASDEIPGELVLATNEATLRELADSGSLAPDIKAGGGVASRVKAGSVEVEFANTGTTTASFPAIDQALATLLVIRSPYSGRLLRG